MPYMGVTGRVEFVLLRYILIYLYFLENQAISTDIKMGGTTPMCFHILAKVNREI